MGSVTIELTFAREELDLMTYRLLHLADLHLDRSFAGLGCHGEVARRRRYGLREALRAAGEAARQQGCQAVTIGGDLYEHERAGTDTERFLVELLASWQPLRVFIAPGNHDPLLPGSLYRRAAWPANVHVFQEPDLAPVELDDGLALWGLAHLEPAWRGNPLARPAATDRINLALYHGSELGSLPEGKAAHGPFRRADIRSQGYALALCGHYHRQRLDLEGGLVYPGSPEPLTFDDTGPRGAVVVEVTSADDILLTAVELNRWWAACVSCDVSDESSTTAVIDAVAAEVTGAVAGRDPGRVMVRAELTGAADPALSIDVFTTEALVREATGVAALTVRDRTEPDLHRMVPAPHSTQEAFLAAARALREAAEDDTEAAVVDDAVRYGLMALTGNEVGLR
jgi:DNA repair exonuclease SbcCD nuclease subunit